MKKMMGYFKPFMMPMLIGIVCMAIHSAIEVQLPGFVAEIINMGIIEANISAIVLILAKMIALVFLGLAFALIEGKLISKVAAGVGQNLRNDLFTKVENLSIEAYGRYNVSSLLIRTTTDIQTIQMQIPMIFRMVLTAPLMIISIFISIFSKNHQLAYVILAIIPVLLILVYYISRKIMPLATRQQEELDRINQVARENLTGVRVIRAFDNETHESERFDAANSQYLKTAKAINVNTSLFMPMFFLVLNIATIIVAWVGSQIISRTQFDAVMAFAPGDLVQIMEYVTMLLMQLIMLSMIIVIYPRLMVSVNRIMEVINEVNPIVNPENPQKPAEDVRGEIEFKDVDFSYVGSETPVLEDINFSIGKGQVLGVIGGTGSGKSTLLNLIPRLADVDESSDGSRKGAVLVDGIDVRDYDIADLRSRIAYAAQKAQLFTGTIEENIRYGYPEATFEEVQRAAQIANAEEFILSKENGYSDILSEGGTNLSGGQKQRLSIARALVRPAEIYIFDDTFSALDFATERKVKDGVSALMKERQATTVLLGQRISSIKSADKIIVIDDGRVVGQGTHRELLDTCKVYKQIALSQISQEELLND